MIQLNPQHSKILHTLHSLTVDPAWPEHSFESLLCLPTVMGISTDDLSCFVLYSVILDEAEILTLATNPDHQRKGLAYNLLTESVSLLKKQGVKTLFLEVDTNNLAAITLYQKLGFNNYGHRPNYYKSSSGQLTDALLMRKNL